MNATSVCNLNLACDEKYAHVDDLDASWLVLQAQNVFTMQIGFMLLEVGSVRATHAKAICVKVCASTRKICGSSLSSAHKFLSASLVRDDA
jgi:hypothetical protein